jgi:3-demethylubiquinone-9 3-methyltransferase
LALAFATRCDARLDFLKFCLESGRLAAPEQYESSLRSHTAQRGGQVADTKIQPFLMFQGKAEEAMNFYVSLFSGAEVLGTIRHGPMAPARKGR